MSRTELASGRRLTLRQRRVIIGAMAGQSRSSFTWRRPLVIVAAFTLFVVAYWVLYGEANAFHRRWIRGEDRLVEWISFLGYAGATLFMAAALRRWSAIPAWTRVFMAGVCVFLFMCAGEEISWGQRAVGFSTPAAIKHHNEQAEFNLHNLDLRNVHPVAIVEALILCFGLLVPLALIRARGPGARAMARSVAPLWVTPIFAWTELLKPAESALRPWVRDRFGDLAALEGRLDTMELLEMFWGLSLFVAAWGVWRAWQRWAEDGGEDRP